MDQDKLDTKRTFIKSLNIVNFRLFHNVEINIGKQLTMISGINGLGKSTILGILAQICSFSKAYIPSSDKSFEEIEIDPNDKKLRTVYDQPFTSKFKDHFMISKKYDIPQNEYKVNFVINDAQEKVLTSATLKGTHRGQSLRFVLRKDKTITDNSSRNITFPTIFLSNRRLTPFVTRKENLDENIFTSEEKEIFKEYEDLVFMPTNSNNHRHISSNRSDISSSVLTNTDYDIESASTGEDNLGQILAALISFIRLKKNWRYYNGGLLLIDEIENSLFPRAQTGLLQVLRKFSAKYNVQVVFTTHSPIIMSEMLGFKQEANKNSKTASDIGINFLNDRSGKVENYKTLSLSQMIATLEVRPVQSKQKAKVNCYCEDKEGYLFLKSILTKTTQKDLNFMYGITLGSENFINLAKKGIPEFSKTSLIVLDGDMKNHFPTELSNFLVLPDSLPPDQLMFYLLKNTDASNAYWQIDEDNWNRSIFLNNPETVAILNNLEFNSKKYCYEIKKKSKSTKPVREYFKSWFNKNYNILKGKVNPIKKIWVPKHQKEVTAFRIHFTESYNKIYSQSHYLS